MSEELKPCPFCGGKAELKHWRWIGNEYRIECLKCETKTQISNDYNMLVKTWNRRANDEKID